MLQLYGHSATAEIGERYFSDDNNKVDKSFKKTLRNSIVIYIKTSTSALMH